MAKSILIKAGMLGCMAVMGGAFGAHALKDFLSSEQLMSFETGIRYQLIHAVVLLFLFLAMSRFESKQLRTSASCIFWGIILFSGSIYLLTLKNMFGIEFLRFAGPITPIGGVLILLGWIFIVVGGVKLKA